MSYQNAKKAAADWIAAAALPEDLRGRVLQMITFATDEDCRFFYPRRALDWQRMVNTAIRKGVLRRKVEIRNVTIAPADYHAWRADRDDTPALRREFADSHQRLLD